MRTSLLPWLLGLSLLAACPTETSSVDDDDDIGDDDDDDAPPPRPAALDDQPWRRADGSDDARGDATGPLDLARVEYRFLDEWVDLKLVAHDDWGGGEPDMALMGHHGDTTWLISISDGFLEFQEFFGNSFAVAPRPGTLDWEVDEGGRAIIFTGWFTDLGFIEQYSDGTSSPARSASVAALAGALAEPGDWYPEELLTPEGMNLSATRQLSFLDPQAEFTCDDPGYSIDDSTGGNGDGRVSPGETFDVIIECTNTGEIDATGTFLATVEFTSTGNEIDAQLLVDSAPLADTTVAPGASTTTASPHPRISVPATAPAGSSLRLVLSVHDDAERLVAGGLLDRIDIN